MTRGTFVAAVVLASVLHGSTPAGATAERFDDARVLPRGAFRIISYTKFFLPIDQRYGPDGDTEDLAADFNRPLDSRTFPLLAPLDAVLGRRASLGDAVVKFELDLVEAEFGLQYGLTDRLTIGVNVPYRWATTEVDARLQTAPGSSANVGRNPRAGQPGQPPVIPLAAGGIPFTEEDVQGLLGPGLPGIPGLGYKRFETRTNNGFGDLEAGFRYQYLRTEDWRLAVTAGARFPTGTVDDPDDLVDYGLGAGAWAVLLRLNQDWIVSNLWTGPRPPGTPGELVINGTFRYDLYLPDKEVRRVPDDVNNPITANRENVSRDLGDRFEFEVSAQYLLPKGFFVSGLYRYAFKLEDEVSGSRGFAYSSLENETARTEHIAIATVGYSTLGLYRDKAFPLPVAASVSYRNRFAGSNNVFRSQYIALTLEVYF